MEVIKRNKKIQKFSVSKLNRSVRDAAKDAKIPVKDRPAIIKKATDPVIKLSKKKETIKSTEIKSMIFKKIPKKYSDLTKAWRSYERKK